MGFWERTSHVQVRKGPLPIAGQWQFRPSRVGQRPASTPISIKPSALATFLSKKYSSRVIVVNNRNP